MSKTPLLLLADDSESKRMLLKALLKHHRFAATILEAQTTQEAVRLIDEHPDIAFAFMDYEIPTEEGPAVIEYLKRKNPEARVALVSAADREEYRREAFDAGAERYICTSDPSDVVERQMGDLLAEWKQAW